MQLSRLDGREERRPCTARLLHISSASERCAQGGKEQPCNFPSDNDVVPLGVVLERSSTVPLSWIVNCYEANSTYIYRKRCARVNYLSRPVSNAECSGKQCSKIEPTMPADCSESSAECWEMLRASMMVEVKESSVFSSSERNTYIDPDIWPIIRIILHTLWMDIYKSEIAET